MEDLPAGDTPRGGRIFAGAINEDIDRYELFKQYDILNEYINGLRGSGTDVFDAIEFVLKLMREEQ